MITTRKKAVVQQLDPFLFHGEPYFQVGLTFVDDPEYIHKIRLGSDAVPPQTRVGDIVWVETVMGTVIKLYRQPSS